MFETSAYNVAAIVAIGMGVAFSVADWRSVTSRWLAAFLVCIGFALHINAGFGGHDSVDQLSRSIAFSGVPAALALITGSQWLLGVRATIPYGALNVRFADRTLRVAQALSVLYAIVSVVLWRDRAQWVMQRMGSLDALLDPIFIIMGLPFFGAMLLLAGAALITLNRKPDAAERTRLIALVVALPFMGLGFVLDMRWGVYGVVFGLMIFLVGAVEYHVVQGQRGQFMSRFLAPQVADMVRRLGLSQAIRDEASEISVVSCDIRGFTAFAERAGTEQVLAVLRSYYDAVGEAATEVGATIKDYAGDGVLILVGAPLAFSDHAQRAALLATMLMERAEGRVHAASGGAPLRLGIGVATGKVSVGVVGGARLEYVAVGSTVNLAARLCQIAQGGEILLDQRTRELLGESRHVETRTPAPLKGFAAPIAHYALRAA